MKKALIPTILLMLAACENDRPPSQPKDDVVIVDEECPRADKQPCR